MKSSSRLISALVLALTGPSAFALTLPVTADSFTTTANTVTVGTGRTATLAVNARQEALMQFDLSALPANYTAGTLVGARLRMYVNRVFKADGGLEVHTATQPWSETTAGAEPTLDPVALAAIAPASLGNKKFVIVDVTEAVRAWLAAPATNFGFAVTVPGATPTARVLLGSKEGPALGFPAELELEVGAGAVGDATNVIVGGAGNTIADGTIFGTIPGGQFNAIGGGANFSFAAGRRAKANHAGSFVWADSTNADFTSTDTNQFSIRAANGLRLVNDAGSSRVVPVGTLYRDNAIVAWGRVTATGALDSGFNVESITKVGTGHYKVTLNTSLQSGFSLIPIVTPEVDEAVGNVPPVGAANVRFAATNQFAAGTNFDIFVYNGSFNSVDNDLHFIVTGR